MANKQTDTDFPVPHLGFKKANSKHYGKYEIVVNKDRDTDNPVVKFKQGLIQDLELKKGEDFSILTKTFQTNKVQTI